MSTTTVFFCIFLSSLLLFLLPFFTVGLRNGLALRPPMGWSTWNTLRCDYTEKDLRDVADALVSSGLAAAGYRSLNIDDCWEADERTADGLLSYNTTKFPNGLKAFGDYLHSLNLSFGLYTSSGPYTCQGYPGSWRHEAEDARTFAEWGVDFLKLDCCYQFNVSDRQQAYSAMSAGLMQSGRSILFSCDTDELILKENNAEYPAEWGPETCNMARIHWDIWDSWQSTTDILTAATNVQHASQPGYWNDLDILTVGMGAQSLTEYITHFQLWCVISSPLIAGNDIRSMSDDVRRVLSNAEAIAINQDPLGVAGNMIRRSLDGTTEVWAKPLYSATNSSFVPSSPPSSSSPSASLPSRHPRMGPASQRSARYVGGRVPAVSALPQPDFHPLPYHAVVLFNRGERAQDVFLDFHDLFDHFLCPHPDPPPFRARVRDAWVGKDIGEFTWNFTATAVPSHGSVLLTVRLL